MKTWVWTALVFVASQGAHGQSRFASLRYNEDHRRFATDSSWYGRMKHFRLGPASYGSAGGEVRYQPQRYRNEDWGDIPDTDYTAFYTRFLLHTSLHIDSAVRVFAQLTSTFASGRVTRAREIDANQADVHQLFFDVFPVRGKSSLILRVGRQEFLYGSQRIIGVREGPNNRQSFDAVKGMFKTGRFALDVFYAQPVRIRPGSFDDPVSNDDKVWSAYGVWKDLAIGGNADLYYIGYESVLRNYNAGGAPEERHSIGTRLWRNKGRFTYDVEALYQWGRFGDGEIMAYTASFHGGYRFAGWRMKPAIDVKTELISGDHSADDDELNTFNPLFPRGAYFGLAALIGPANLIDFHPGVELAVAPSLSLMADYDAFWRYDDDDGIYGPNMGLIYGSESRQRFIGHQYGVSAEYSPDDALKFTGELMYFDARGYLHDVSPGKNVWFSALTIQFKY